MNGVDAFFRYARERYRILLRRRAGGSYPWTRDPVLREYSFCNVFREDDRVTQWVRENVRDSGKYTIDLVTPIGIARWFNRIPTMEALHREGLLLSWDRQHALEVLEPLAEQGPVFTGAFIVMAHGPGSKLENVCDCIDEFLPVARRLQRVMEGTHSSMQWLHDRLVKEVRGLGPFMAYELVCDLRHTPLLRNAPDRTTWANPGPGAKRGLSRMFHGRPDMRLTRLEQLEGMRYLLRRSRAAKQWPREWPAWEMREVEHTLCEFDKYERAKEGGKMKRRYHPCTS